MGKVFFSNERDEYGWINQERSKIFINNQKLRKEDCSPEKVIEVLIHEQLHMNIKDIVSLGKLKGYVDSFDDYLLEYLEEIKNSLGKKDVYITFEEIIINELTRDEMNLDKDSFKKITGSKLDKLDTGMQVKVDNFINEHVKIKNE